MIYVVTGGAGFIGSNVVKELNDRGERNILVVDDFGSDERWRNLADCFVTIVNPKDVWLALREIVGPVTLIHLGARTSTTDKNVEALIETNIRLTTNLFDYCVYRNWKFIWASSASVYGKDADRKSEVDAVYPLSPYAWSKAEAETSILNRSYKPPVWFALRLFNVYGPREAHKGAQRSFVTKCFDAIRAGEAVEIFGNNSIARDWIYIKDIAKLIVDLANKDFGSGIYNVGTGRALNFYEVYRICTGPTRSIDVVIIPFPKELRKGYQTYTRANIDKLKRIMPDFKFMSLEEGIADYWRQDQ